MSRLTQKKKPQVVDAWLPLMFFFQLELEAVLGPALQPVVKWLT